MVARHGGGINETALAYAMTGRVLRRNIDEVRIDHIVPGGSSESVAVGGRIDKSCIARGRLQRGGIGRRFALLRQYRLDHHRRRFRLQTGIGKDLLHLRVLKAQRGKRLAQMLLHRGNRGRILRQAMLLPVALQGRCRAPCSSCS